MGPEDVGKIRVGSLTPFTFLILSRIQYIRDLKAFFGTTFKIVPDHETKTVILSTVGNGHINVNKKVS